MHPTNAIEKPTLSFHFMSRPYDVFVSYSREDKVRVLPWIEELKRGGVSAFFDSESLLGGVKWQHEIVEAIRTAKLVILFVSRASVASEFVPKELALSVDMKKDILPLMLEETEIRGQMAFCIAGLHRVTAYDQDDPAKILRDIQASLQHVGIEWKSPSRSLNGILRESRDVSLDDGKGNVRLHRKAENRAEPTAVPDVKTKAGEESVPEGRWLRRWSMLMILAGLAGLFFWMDGAAWVDSKPVLQEPPKPGVVETLEEEVGGLAQSYYLSTNQSPAAQLVFLAEKVDYLGHLGATRSEVGNDIKTYGEKWTNQQTDVLKPPAARVIEAGKLFECEVPLRISRENAVVKSIAIVTGRLRLQMINGALKIVAVSEVSGTRKTETLQFRPEAQKNAAVEFITRAVVSGSSNSGMTPQDIAAMYVEKPDYLGHVAKHTDIEAETGRLIALWELRDYKVLEGPEIVSGLGTPDVEVKVGLEYHVGSPSRGGKINQGWVRSAYLVHFSDEGVPLIQKHAEIERGQ